MFRKIVPWLAAIVVILLLVFVVTIVVAGIRADNYINRCMDDGSVDYIFDEEQRREVCD